MVFYHGSAKTEVLVREQMPGEEARSAEAVAALGCFHLRWCHLEQKQARRVDQTSSSSADLACAPCHCDWLWAAVVS